jgi:ribonuclease HII
MSLKPSLEFELMNSYDLIVGVDEVGRGCLAGPVMVGGYFMTMNSINEIDGVYDSKKLSLKTRNKIFDQVDSSEFIITLRSTEHIDKYGITNSIVETIYDIKNYVETNFPLLNYIFLIDGVFKHKFNFNFETFVKGDSKVYSIAMASILAKVTRDRYMSEITNDYPDYGWETNKGYGTKYHMDAIKKYGSSKHHRMSFIS